MIVRMPWHLMVWAILVAGTGCGLPEGDYFGKVDPDPDPTHLRWCNSGEPEYLDPALSTSTTDMPLIYGMFDGLTDHNMQGLPERSLATHWEISTDQRRFTFHLHDKGRWSNGRPVTSHDFAYHMMRVLHPLTFSRNADLLWKLKNAQLFTEGRVKLLRADTGPFRQGDVVEVLGVALPGAETPGPEDPSTLDIPDSNLRTSGVPLALRDLGAPEHEAYATVPPGQEVTIVELDTPPGGDAAAGASEEWAYVHWAEGDGVYGWVPASLLTGQPNGEVVYWVRTVPMPHRVGVEVAPDDLARELAAEQPLGRVRGADMLMLPEVLGIRTPDDYTLVVETWGPVPYLIDLTPQRGFRATPREVISRWPQQWTKPDRIVTSGPFHLVDWHERDSIELVKSKTYWRRDQVRLERLTAYSINDQAASANYYMQGSCDAVTANHIPSSYLPALNGEKRGRPYKDFTSAPYLGAYFYLLNTEKLTNVHLRRALNFAIDRSAFPKILHGGQIPSARYTPGTPISQLSDDDLALCGVTRDTPGVAMIVISGELCYVPPPGLDFDPDKARAELALAREQLGDAFPETLSLKFNSGSEGHKMVAEYMQQQWKQTLGLDVELISQEWKTYLKATTAGEYEIARMGWIGSFPEPESEFVSIFKCGSPYNRPRWCNDEFERVFRQAEATADRKQRLALIREAERIMVEDAPIIPLYVYMQQHLQKPYVRDLAINLPAQPPLFRAWIDPQWRAHRGSEGEGN